MRRVAIIGAGGTIAMEGAHAFDWVDYGDTGIINPVDRIVAGMEFGLSDIGFTLHPFRMLPGTGIRPTDWFDLQREIVAIAASGEVDGIVVTHGTATLEETAFFLHLTLDCGLPVVVSGAQRPPNTASSDAVSGLRNALVATANAPPGVYVAMNGHLFAAEDVSKTANHALDAFESPEFGPLGRIEASGQLSMRRRTPERPHVFDLTGLCAADMPRVDVVMSYAGADGVVIDALVAAGSRVLISSGFPPGRCTPLERAALLRAVACGVIVVQSSRANRGTVPVQPYNAADRILSGGSLPPHKARILVMLGIAAGMSSADLERLLQRY